MTFHFELCNHPNKKGDFSVFLLVFHKGQKKRIKTTILIPDKYWDPEKDRLTLLKFLVQFQGRDQPNSRKWGFLNTVGCGCGCGRAGWIL